MVEVLLIVLAVLAAGAVLVYVLMSPRGMQLVHKKTVSTILSDVHAIQNSAPLTPLHEIYPWAGKYRQVNVGKDSFSVAASAQVPKVMAELEKGPLRRHTPCRPGKRSAARVVAVLMGLQAGLAALYFDKPSGRLAVSLGMEAD